MTERVRSVGQGEMEECVRGGRGGGVCEGRERWRSV